MKFASLAFVHAANQKRVVAPQLYTAANQKRAVVATAVYRSQSEESSCRHICLQQIIRREQLPPQLYTAANQKRKVAATAVYCSQSE